MGLAINKPQLNSSDPFIIHLECKVALIKENDSYLILISDHFTKSQSNKNNMRPLHKVTIKFNIRPLYKVKKSRVEAQGAT